MHFFFKMYIGQFFSILIKSLYRYNFYFRLFSNFKYNPSSGLNIMAEYVLRHSWLSRLVTFHLRKISASTIFTSSCAYFWPMQFLGPAENGIYKQIFKLNKFTILKNNNRYRFKWKKKLHRHMDFGLLNFLVKICPDQI